ncbi:sigma-70 family RNA polymerase sigma factor [Kitasatospora sp. NPDC052896]|uniref:sigma-70 family RNA polymerase sigma factor n=1 Tax=Kitasatospora sp. NPDC052896 TaxID=3364061 RepID=UPI0037CC8EAB
MSDAPPADAANTRAPLPVPFRGFHELHAQPYLDYATAHLADDGLALELVDDVFTALADHWTDVLAQSNPTAYAWALLRRVVEAECVRRDEHLVLVEKTAFAYAMRENVKSLLDGLDASVTDLEDGITLAAAIRSLSGSKHDVIVLRYLMGYSVNRIATVMGVETATIRSLICQAKTKLAARLASRRLLRPGPIKHDAQE